MSSTTPLLSIENLTIAFNQKVVVQDITFNLQSKQTTALVGESGSGKSVTALSILKLLPYPLASHPQGQILFKDKDLLKSTEKELRQVRGGKISMIFQEPMTSLNPLHTVEKQVQEVIKLHSNSSASSQRIEELLKLVQLKNIEQKRKAYPHQLSGGERQRVMIAMAIAAQPMLLIADEPTTALDVTTQAEILSLLQDLQQRFDMALLLITHDLAIVRRMAENVVVMEKGMVVEQGTVEKIFNHPSHPYTQQLLSAENQGGAVSLPAEDKLLLKAENITVQFPIKTGLWRRKIKHFKAVNDVSFSLKVGETLGIVGESGSGKSTLALALLRLIPFQGTCYFGTHSLAKLSQRQMRPLRKDMQIVFQDPYAALSPRITVEEIIGEGLEIHFPTLNSLERSRRIEEILHEVGLDHDMKNRYPHEFSGGQRQRIAIARAIILKPELLILDEPTSALDRAIQVDIIDLLKGLQTQHRMTYIFISHDLKTVQAISHKVIVMKEGAVVESGQSQQIFHQPQHPYTQRLIEAAFALKI